MGSGDIDARAIIRDDYSREMRPMTRDRNGSQAALHVMILTAVRYYCSSQVREE
jgi:hypothetical protein